MRVHRSSLVAGVVLALGLVQLAGTPRAVAFDWRPFEQERTIRILTHDEDGDPRETKVWTVVVDGVGYIRTTGSAWLENIQRNPEVQIRLRGYEYLMRAEVVRDAKTRARVEEAYREKYGFVQSTMSLLRFREPTVLRLVPRTANDRP